ncbi:MAG: cation diffusion facilitator family transporter, partial [Candidatus Saccharibacteria bacterium]|nr:cation diffusion facilitator family transporter [Candidatus Saccharibacteria bacterium]
VNLVLVGFKAAVGLIAGSISIVLDAVNNLTDAMSSVVTIVGVKLSQKRPDYKHPFGYGRVEYFSALVVAIIVLAAGLAAFRESIEKIITPVEANYSIISLVIVGVAVVVKLFFGRYVKKKGEKLNSGSLRASGIDAISDAALSFSVLVGAIISYIWHISLEGYIGLVIAVVIIKTAIEILGDAANDLIGTRTDEELNRKIKKTIESFDAVQGVYDLALHNYGPNKKIASAHIQIGDELRTRGIHRLSRQIEIKVFEEHGVILTVGVYAANESGIAKKMREKVEKILGDYASIKQMHGFYLDEEYKVLTFDLVFDFEEKNTEEIVKEIRKKIKKFYPDYDVYIVVDTDLI